MWTIRGWEAYTMRTQLSDSNRRGRRQHSIYGPVRVRCVLADRFTFTFFNTRNCIGTAVPLPCMHITHTSYSAVCVCIVCMLRE